ncbi:MAG: asparagine--tRNA ligase [Proteobacteria bacterium]|nr:asparagine--tRNA ligase [Pseudomonadota bacterium]
MTIKDLLINRPSETEMISVSGWVRSKRAGKKRAFVTLSDGSTHQPIQCVIEASSPGFGQVSHVITGTAIKVLGNLVASPGIGQSYEIVAHSCQILGAVDEHYPLQKKHHSLEFLRDIAHLRARTQTLSSVFRVRSVLSLATHTFFQNRGFHLVHTPVLTAIDAEGAGDMFTVTNLNIDDPPRDTLGKVDYRQDFFASKAYLNVTGQLQAEYLALGMGRVYTFGPTFRAENSNTKRHLAEFWMIEPELAFADLDDCIELASDHVLFLLRKCVAECGEELEFFQQKHEEFSIGDLEKMAKQSSFARMTYSEAVTILQQASKTQKLGGLRINWGEDLAREHEQFLCEEYIKGPLFVTDYPKNCKAFYMRLNDDEKTVACMDFLVPKSGELIGGSQREERWDVLAHRMSEEGVGSELDWYLDLRKQGTVVHSGYGLGLERMVLLCTGVANVRDTIPSPRTPGNIRF